MEVRVLDRSAMVLIRAWLDPGDGALRACVTASGDLLTPDGATVTVGSVDDVCELVRTVLAALGPP